MTINLQGKQYPLTVTSHSNGQRIAIRNGRKVIYTYRSEAGWCGQWWYSDGRNTAHGLDTEAAIGMLN